MGLHFRSLLVGGSVRCVGEREKEEMINVRGNVDTMRTRRGCNTKDNEPCVCQQESDASRMLWSGQPQVNDWLQDSGEDK